LWLTVFVDQLGFGIVVPFLPLYAAEHGASAFGAGLLLATYSAAQMLVSVRWGRLSDRIGRRPVIVAAAAGGAAGFLVLGAAGSLAVLFVGRALLGGFGVAMQTAQAWIADATAPEERGRELAALGAVAGLGFVLGPAVGAAGILAGGTALPFFLSAACAAGNAALAAAVLPRMPPRVAGAGDAVAPVAGGRAAGRAGGLRLIAPCLVVGFVLTYAFSGVEATFALFTRDALDFAPADNGWLFGGMAVIAALAQLSAVRWLAGRVDEPRRVALGLALLGIGIALVPAARSLGAILPPLAVLAIGYAITAPSLAAWVSRRAPADRQGELLGLAASASAMARVAGPGVGGLLFDHVGHGAPFHVAAVMIGGAAAVALRGRPA
jgi:DHA1 family tetracycline resistance protein-like MFS transporter